MQKEIETIARRQLVIAMVRNVETPAFDNTNNDKEIGDYERKEMGKKWNSDSSGTSSTSKSNSVAQVGKQG